MLSVQIITDPFEAYQERLKKRLERQDQSDEATRRREEARKEREKDRTTWLGTDLGKKGESKADREARMEGAGGVGKYIGGGAAAKVPVVAAKSAPGPETDFGVEKKKRKVGGFGDFSGW